MSFSEQRAPADDLLLGSARDMLRALDRGGIGAEELLRLHWERSDRLNPVLNAIVDQDRDSALAAARHVDRIRAQGGRAGVLAGLPMTIKDSFAVAGMSACCGMPAMKDHRPAADAVAVARLRRAGAVIYGKTNVPYACGDHQSYNDVHGTTRNPWDPSRTPGGSSGGSAAALAAGLTALELGSDIGGSIRCPAHFCGVYGHKTTYGLLPGAGHLPPAPDPSRPPELSVIGPLARDPGDLSLALDVLLDLSGADGAAPLPVARHARLADFRVGLWLDAYPLESACRAAILRFVDDLRHAGARIDEGARPDIDPAKSSAVYLETLFGVLGSRMDEKARDAFVTLARAAGPVPYAEALLRAVERPGHLDPAIRAARAGLGRAWRAFFDAYDVLICPVTATTAFPHDHAGGHGPAAQLHRTLQVDGRPRPYLDTLQWPSLATVANLPATAMPTGRRVDGLPVGVQIIGPLAEDRTPLRFAELAARHLEHSGHLGNSGPLPAATRVSDSLRKDEQDVPELLHG